MPTSKLTQVLGFVATAVLLASGIMLAPATEAATLTPAKPRIVNGNASSSNGFKYAVALVNRWNPDADQGQFCGGSYLGQNWVVTAAHCVQGRNAGSIDVVSGRKNLTARNGKRTHVSRVIVHKQYGSPVEGNNDIAVIKLVGTPKARAVPVASKSEMKGNLGQMAVGGWGCTEQYTDPTPGACTSDSMFPSVLLRANVYRVSREFCEQAYAAVGTTITDREICAADFATPQRDACQGDSGGPLVRFRKGDARLVGIVSEGRGCADYPYAGIYTKVPFFKSWIERVTGCRF